MVNPILFMKTVDHQTFWDVKIYFNAVDLIHSFVKKLNGNIYCRPTIDNQNFSLASQGFRTWLTEGVHVYP